MTTQTMDEVLREAVHEVMEKMFFLDVGDDGEEHPADAPAAAAEVRFRGEHNGEFRLEIDIVAARPAAADFLGVDVSELTADQVDEVVLELSNMVCGAVLSRVESGSLFRLDKPRMVEAGGALPSEGEHSSFEAQAGGGRLGVKLRMEHSV
jgi:hypothetical protein